MYLNTHRVALNSNFLIGELKKIIGILDLQISFKLINHLLSSYYERAQCNT